MKLMWDDNVLIMFLLEGTVRCSMNITTKPTSMGITAGGSVTGEAIIPTITNSAIQLSFLLEPNTR